MTDEKEKTVSRRDKIDIHIEDFKIFAEEFRDESDRSAVILGAAKIDYLLYQLLQNHMLPNPTGNDDLLDGDSPLSTFSARINACYRLGLIDAGLTRALHMIRKTRNAFAHEASNKSLDSGAHKDRINEFVRPLERVSLFKTILRMAFKDSNTPGARFRAGVALISLRLALYGDRIEPIKADNALKMETEKTGAT